MWKWLHLANAIIIFSSQCLVRLSEIVWFLKFLTPNTGHWTPDPMSNVIHCIGQTMNCKSVIMAGFTNDERCLIHNLRMEKHEFQKTNENVFK